MNYSFEIEFKGDHIHVKEFGPDSYDASLGVWKEIMVACKTHNCFNILGESFTTEPLSTMDAFDVTEIFILVGVTQKHRIAWVPNNNDESLQFVETVLLNRGLLNGGLFPTVEKAKEWLL